MKQIKSYERRTIKSPIKLLGAIIHACFMRLDVGLCAALPSMHAQCAVTSSGTVSDKPAVHYMRQHFTEKFNHKARRRRNPGVEGGQGTMLPGFGYQLLLGNQTPSLVSSHPNPLSPSPTSLSLIHSSQPALVLLHCEPPTLSSLPGTSPSAVPLPSPLSHCPHRETHASDDGMERRK